MARKKLTQTQIGFIILLWVFIVGLILYYSHKITVATIFPIVLSGIIIFIPIYKSLRK